MKLRKNFYERYMVLEKTLVQFVCTYLVRGRCNSVFFKIILIVISRLVENGIAQKFLGKIHNIRKNIGTICVYIP